MSLVSSFRSGLVLSALSLLVLITPSQAGVKIGDDDKWISIGAGMKTAFKITEDSAPNGTDSSKTFALDDVRLYINGSVTETIQVEINTVKSLGDNVDILDAVFKLQLSDSFNIWMGQHIPPSDRSNYSGGFYQNTFDFPAIASRYAIQNDFGRDDGLSFYGKFADNKFLYHVGIFDGNRNNASAEDNLLYAFRVSYSFLDVEPAPFYYTGGTYYGDADILTVGFALNYQEDGVAAGVDDTTWNFDVLFEKALDNDGVITIEGAYYSYDRQGSAPNFGGAPINGDGNAYLIYVGYLIPTEIGIGKLQPHIRYQDFDDDANLGQSQIDIGVNYVIAGHNGRITLVYSIVDSDVAGAAENNTILLGGQFQF